MGNVYYLPSSTKKVLEEPSTKKALALMYLETVKLAVVVHLLENKIALPRQGIGIFNQEGRIIVFNRATGDYISDVQPVFLANRMGVTKEYLLSIIPSMEIVR